MCEEREQTAGSSAVSRSRSAYERQRAGWLRTGLDHLSAQLKPRDELSAAERRWDIEAVLNAHLTRSAEVGRVYEQRASSDAI